MNRNPTLPNNQRGILKKREKGKEFMRRGRGGKNKPFLLG